MDKQTLNTSPTWADIVQAAREAGCEETLRALGAMLISTACRAA